MMAITYPVNFHKFRMTFRAAIIMAVILHLIGLFIYALEYKPEIIKVPFKVLEVKLGNMKFASKQVVHDKPEKVVKAAPPQPKKPVKTQKKVAKKTKATKPSPPQKRIVPPVPVDKPAIEIIQPVIVSRPKPPAPQQLVEAKPQEQLQQPLPVSPPAEGGQKNREAARGMSTGNEKLAELEVVNGYKQQLVLWLEKHKAYPKGAREDKLSGYALMRIRLNNKGNILSRSLASSTGKEILDQAILDMIDRSNPMPAFPPDYPDVEVDEFIIPAQIAFEKKDIGNVE